MYSTRLGKYTVSFPNSTEFHELKREIFSQHIYYWDENLEKPYIIDAGAHIGLATLYFKSLWPDAEILAIEPNPQSIEYLQKNIEDNQLTNITILPVALSWRGHDEELYIDNSGDEWNSTASFFPRAWNNMQPGEPIKVPTQSLQAVLTRPVDILKMDIEGLEEAVLTHAGERIRQVKHLFIEFHGRKDNSLSRIIKFLEDNRFVVEVSKNGRPIDPAKVTGLALVEAHQRV
jgi:FkbM family methyltransferase